MVNKRPILERGGDVRLPVSLSHNGRFPIAHTCPPIRPLHDLHYFAGRCAVQMSAFAKAYPKYYQLLDTHPFPYDELEEVGNDECL